MLRARSSSSAGATDQLVTGARCSAGSRARCFKKPHPSRRGINKSSRIRSAGQSAKASTASMPSKATRASYPSEHSNERTVSARGASSLTTRTRGRPQPIPINTIRRIEPHGYADFQFSDRIWPHPSNSMPELMTAQTFADRQERRLRTVSHAQLYRHVGDHVPYGSFGEIQVQRDFGIGRARGEQVQDLPFAGA